MTTTRNQGGFRAVYCFVAALGLALAGCGGNTGDVSGTVRFKGKPLSGGQVTFTGQDNPGASAFAWIGTDGSYSIHGCPTGLTKITVLPLERNRGGQTSGTTKRFAAASKSDQRRKPPSIPLRYVDPNTTDLEFSVAGGVQHHDIELKP
jgi:hypothetical protein